MPNYLFFKLLNDNLGLYLVSLVLCSIPLYYIAKYYTHSWLDPLRYALFTVPLANSVPLFLFYMNEISPHLFYYTLSAEILFWVGFLIPSKRSITFSKVYISEDAVTIRILFFMIFILYVISYIFTYTMFGIPIFLESRLITYFGSGGFGALGRINSFFEVFILIYCYWQLSTSSSFKTKVIYFVPFILIAIIGILSGSRSSAMTFFVCFFGYSHFYARKKINDSRFIKYFPIILVGALAVLIIKNGGNILAALLAVVIRLVATGDCYYMGYPNDIINLVDTGNSTLFLASNILAPLRIIDISTIASPVGVQLTSILFPNLDGLFVGPNARPPILGYVLFGGMGMLFTFITGFMTSCILFRLPSIFPRGFVPSVVLFYIYMVSIRFIGDPTFGIASLFDVALNILVLMFLIVISYIIKSSCTRVQYTEN